MRIGQLIWIAGFNRDTFNSLRRKGHLSFLGQDTDDDQGLDRYRDAHALALTVFYRLRQLGVSPAVADAAIGASWKDIEAVVGGREPKHARCGIRVNQKNVLEEIAFPRPWSDPSLALAEAGVALVAAWDDTCKALRQLAA